MAQNDAMRFLERCAAEDGFRAEAYEAEGPEGFIAWVKGSGYEFTWLELENAGRQLKLRAQDEGEAAFVEELLMWYQFLAGGNGSSGASSSCDTSLCATCGVTGCAGGVGTRAAVRPGVEA